jgi:hypothetical protein
MADKKISELTALTGANVADTDLLPIVDTSATETKKITFGEFKTALDTATGFVRITGDTMTGDLSFGDNNKAIFGDSSDLQIYHDSSNSYIADTGTGDLYIQAGNEIFLQNTAGITYFYGNQAGQSTVGYAGTAKLATTDTGIDVTGDITLGDTNPTITFNDSSIVSLSHTVSSASDNLRLAVDVNGVDAGSRVEIFDGSTEVARFSSGAVLVTGTVTAEGLTVDGTLASPPIVRISNDGGSWVVGDETGRLQFYTTDASGIGAREVASIRTTKNSSGSVTCDGTLEFWTSPYNTVAKKSMEIDGETGDISFYEDTGETPKFFWDASLEALGVGITPSTAMHVYSASGNTALRVETGLTNGQAQINFKNDARRYNVGINSSDNLVFEDDTAGLTRMTIDSSGNVGIGTSSFSSPLTVNANPGAVATPVAWLHNSGNVADYDGVVISSVNDGSDAEVLHVRTNNTTYANGTSLMLVRGDGNVGIGTSSPNRLLKISASSATAYDGTSSTQSGATLAIANINNTLSDTFADLQFECHGTSTGFARIGMELPAINKSELFFNTQGSSGIAERMRIDSSGNVGIGNTTSGYVFTAAETRLTVGDGAEHAAIQLYSGTTKWGGIAFSDDDVDVAEQGLIGYYHPNNYMTFNTAGSEAVRIDSSGHTTFGTTDLTPAESAVNGTSILADGRVNHNAQSQPAAIIGRTGTEGTIVDFRKSGASVGSIGTTGGKLYIGTLDGSDAFLRFESNEISPCANNGSFRDNVINLGKSESRFDDIYASNGTIQTSDRNEKQDIDVMSEAETRVAVACKGLIRKFRWIDAVAEKGDDARIHFGIIAQDLQDAFAAEGLDAGRYAMFISSTWWETQTDVPAVEAVEGAEATYDDEGNQLTEAVEAVVAVAEHTVTDHYDTLEEAPEGATERTRLGVRYPELLAFIIGAL